MCLLQSTSAYKVIFLIFGVSARKIRKSVALIEMKPKRMFSEEGNRCNEF